MKIEFDTEKDTKQQLELISKIIETKINAYYDTKIEDSQDIKYLKVNTDDSVGMAEVKQTMNHLMDDQGHVMIVEEIIARIGNKRMDKKVVLELLKELKIQGEICEPKDGFVRVV